LAFLFRSLNLLLLLRLLLWRLLLSWRSGGRLRTALLDLTALQLVGHCLKFDGAHNQGKRLGAVLRSRATEKGFGLLAVISGARHHPTLLYSTAHTPI